MRVSLKTIARELNLSATTVSWVLQGKGNERKISAKTQALVRDLAEKYDYSPNLLAKSLNKGVSNTLGLIIPSIDDVFYSQIAKAIESEADKYGCIVMFCSSERDKSREKKLIKTLRDRRVDGIIIAPTKQQSESIEFLVQESFPLVVIDRFFDEFATNSIVVDNEAASCKLIKHLISKGAKKIAILTTDTHINVINFRYEGYKKAHNQAGITIYPDLYKDINRANYVENTEQVMDEIFNANPDVDGFFFVTHYLAHEGLTYLHMKNKDVNKFHLACIHDMPHFKVYAPKMNIANQPVDDIGREAVRMLMSEIINGDSIKRMFVIPNKIVIRDS